MREIIKDISEILKIDEQQIKDLKRFNTGMSNYTYYFKVKDTKYVYRKIGLDADLFVNYHHELNHLKQAYKHKITSELVYFNENTGTKIQKYINGETIDFKNVNRFSQKLIKTLKTLHSIKDDSIASYNSINRLNKYQSYLEANDLSDDYFMLKEYFINTYQKSFINNELVFCHNDLQNINVIEDNSNIYLIDFEYAGYNDIYYDFATFETNAFKVYELYYDQVIDEMSKNKIMFYQLYQSIQWYLVATYKEKVGFSKLTNYDFNDLANYFINNALSLYQKIKGVNFDAIS